MAKIGLDIQAVMTLRKTGLGVYVNSLLKAMLGKDPSPGVHLAHGNEFYLYGSEKPIANTLERLVWENLRVSYRARKDRVKLLHVPAFSPPIIYSGKLVVTVHDLIGKLFPNQRGFVSAFYWGKWLPWAVSRADLLIANSESTKNDLMNHLNVREEKIRIVYGSGHEDFSPELDSERIQRVSEKYGIKKDYFLFVGTVEPRKNLKRILNAFASLNPNIRTKHQLVVVGAKDFAHGNFMSELLKDCHLQPGELIFTDYVNHEDLRVLYSGALAFLFPSLYEGFGIPVLEAMACGAPVIASTASSVPEVAGKAALLVDPLNTDDIKDAMVRIATDKELMSSLRQAGLSQLKKFSWQRSAQQMLDIYKELI